MDEITNADERTARMNVAPLTFLAAHCDKPDLNVPMAGDSCA